MTMTWPNHRFEPTAMNLQLPIHLQRLAVPHPYRLVSGKGGASFDMVFGSKTVGGHSAHGESNEPDVALPGVGGHSVHGQEDQWCPHPPLDGGGQIWVADRWG